MSDETHADNGNDLDSFSADFFGQKSDTPVETKTEKEVKAEVHADAPNDAHSAPDDTGSDLGDNDAGSDPAEKATKPKTRFQERIDELTAKAREAERERDELREKLKGQNPEPKETPKPKAAELTEPTPGDLNDDGTEKYELGEFDPKFIKDLTKYALMSEKASIEAEAEKRTKVEKMNAEKAELETAWKGKLPTAQERYPDFMEKGQALESTFSGINAAYGEYLGATIMSLDNGPDVLYYLANNPDEAKRIVAGGPAKAAVALGKIDSKFDSSDEGSDSDKPAVKVSKAPPPAPQNKGVSQARATIADDTDDLDAFSSKLFDKRYGKRH